MKINRLKTVLLLVVIAFPSLLIAQQNSPFVPAVPADEPSFLQEKNSNWRVLAYGGIGFGTVNNTKAPEYDVNFITGQFLVNYKFDSYFGVSSGVGLLEISGNGFDEKGAFYHKRKTLTIPVLFTMTYPLDTHVILMGHLGINATKPISGSYAYLKGTTSNVYTDWGLGSDVAVGLAYRFSEGFSLGFRFQTQADFIAMKSSLNTNEQKLDKLNSLGIFLAIAL